MAMETTIARAELGTALEHLRKAEKLLSAAYANVKRAGLTGTALDRAKRRKEAVEETAKAVYFLQRSMGL